VVFFKILLAVMKSGISGMCHLHFRCLRINQSNNQQEEVVASCPAYGLFFRRLYPQVLRKDSTVKCLTCLLTQLFTYSV
jgi:Fe-S oxidoreductase